MSDLEGVQFHEVKPAVISQAPPPKMVRWLMKISRRYIKTEKQAVFTMLGFSLFAIVISLFLFFGGGSSPKSPSEERIFPHLQLPIE